MSNPSSGCHQIVGLIEMDNWVPNSELYKAILTNRLIEMEAFWE